MTRNLIGDKKIFAIEYSVLMLESTPLYGDCLIWLGGNSLGGLEGEAYLGSVCQYLEVSSSIKEQLFLEEHLYNLSDAELFDLMWEQKIDEKGTYMFLDLEGFDLFRNYIYRRDETFHFLWQLSPKVWKRFEPQGVPTQLFSAQVAITKYEEVVKEFRNALMKLHNFPVLAP